MSTGWKPRCALRVGVIGNRRFGDTDEESTPAAEVMKKHAAAALHVVWAAFFDSMLEALRFQLPGRSMRRLFSDDLPRLAILTSLAAGADQIGAETALDAKTNDVAVDLEAILPFAEGDYPGLPHAPRSEFRPREAAALRALAARAAQVVRLPGDFRTEASKKAGYAQARDLLLQNCDILVAVYRFDAPPGGQAGTLESVALALEQEIPVVAVLLSESEARIHVVYQKPQQSIRWEDAHAVDDPAWKAILVQCIRERLVLPEALQGDGNVDQALFRLDLMSGDKPSPWICRNEIATRLFGRMWSDLQAMGRQYARRDLRVKLDQAEERAAKTHARDPSLQPYAGFYHLASRNAVDFMRMYRGAFVLTYLLAALAVAAAVTLMVAPPSLAVMLALCAIKIGILLLLLALERAGHRLRFQEAAADFRYLAELLRPMEWLMPIGTYPPYVVLPLHAAPYDLHRSWMAWLVRAAARSSPTLPPRGDCGSDDANEIALTTADAAAALDRARTEWIAGQVAYHDRTAARMHVLDHGLERLSKGLLLIVLAAAAIACAIEIFHIERFHEVAPLFNAYAAFLPALIAAFAGIAFQSEAKRLAMRSEAMVHGLKALQKELAAEAEAIRASGARDSSAIMRAATALRRTSRMTIEEAADWKVLYQIHPIHAG